VGKMVGVLVGGNQKVVGVAVVVTGMGVAVCTDAGNRLPVQAVRKMSRNR
jgi:hypothetical protein